MEEPRPRPRGDPRVQRHSGTRAGGPPLPARAHPLRAARQARFAPRDPESLHEMAGGPLGARDPRGHRIPAWGSFPVRDEGPGPPSLARARLPPRIRGDDGGRVLWESGGTSDAWSVSTVRLAAGQRALFPGEAWDRRRAHGRPRGTPFGLAVAGRGGELRSESRSGQLLVLGAAAGDARTRHLRRTDRECNRQGRGKTGR